MKKIIKNVWTHKLPNVFPLRMLLSVYHMMAPWGSSVITIHHGEQTSFTAISLHHFVLLMNKISKRCLQNWGVEKYCCVDTWAVSLPPTLALFLDASGCLPPFEMLIDFSVQNFFSSSMLVLSAYRLVSLIAFTTVSPFHKQFTCQHRNSCNIWCKS